MKMTGEQLIHLKLEHREALRLKRDLLSAQMGLLKTARTLRGYGYFRSEELKLRAILYKEIRDVKLNIGKLQKILPKLKVPEILRKEEKTEIDKTTKPEAEKKAHKGDNLEAQLQEIQNRLNQLQRESI
jgi:hypothetical protein